MDSLPGSSSDDDDSAKGKSGQYRARDINVSNSAPAAIVTGMMNAKRVTTTVHHSAEDSRRGRTDDDVPPIKDIKDRPLAQHDFDIVSKKIGMDWMKLASELVRERDIQRIKRGHDENDTRAMADESLKLWQRQNPEECNLKDLYTHLKKIDRLDIIKKILKNSTS